MELQHPFVLRALQQSDFHKGYLQLLEQLTKVGNISEEEFTSRLEQVQNAGDSYKIAVIEDLDKKQIVATGTVLIELKFVRNCGKAGHIEDVVVDQSTRGQHLGQRMVEHLTKVAKEVGCYKVILDCSKENVPFYEKCDLHQKGIQMAHYF
ncbi:unnamed protein product [Calypogeia fissa]